MEAMVYAAEAGIEQTHWWFVGRRNLFARLLRRLQLDAHSTILDVGTSTGTNLRLLRSLGYRDVCGVDVSLEAIRYCRDKGLGIVLQGDACDLPFASSQFDLVLATDILEHLDDDGRALAEIYRVLKPGGHALITVPAFPFLWGLQDEVSHHRRRYRQKRLRGLLDDAGLSCRTLFYFNFLLFWPIWLARQIIRVARIRLRSENDVNNPLINWVLTRVFGLDIWCAPWLRPPFGVSLLAICSRPRDTADVPTGLSRVA